MTGLFLFAVLVVWLIVVIFVVWTIGRCFKSRLKKIAAALISFMLIFILPFSDELIGSYQLKGLCEKDGVIRKADLERAKGMELLVRMDGFKPVSGQVLDVQRARYNFLDPETKDVVFWVGLYRVGGGFFVRSTGISESNSPLLFIGNCSSIQGKRINEILKDYEIKSVFE